MGGLPQGRFWSVVFLCALAQGCTNPALQTGRINNSGTHAPPESLLDCSPEEVDFGQVPALAQRQAVLSLTNHGKEPVEVACVYTTCGCVRIQLHKTSLQPAETVTANCLLDLRAEPTAKGAIRVEVEGLTPTGSRAFAITANVSIKEPANADS